VSAVLAHSSPRVTAEARGWVRVFRAEVRAADERFETALAGVITPLRERLRRHTRLREEQARIAALAYRREAPPEFRLGELSITPDRDRFMVQETRLIATWFCATAWGDDDAREPGVALVTYTVRLERGRLRVGWVPLAIISGHALGRFFERTGRRTHAALVADLAVLADAGPDGDRVAVGDGWWMGAVVPMQGKHGITSARSIRTYRTGPGRSRRDMH
jgi:hypothetical protein